MPQSRDQRGDVLQLAAQIRRPIAVGDEAAEAARGGEWSAEADRGRSVAGQGDASGRDPPKNMKPARKRQMVRSRAGNLASEHSSGLPSSPRGSIDLPLPAAAPRAGRA